MVQKLDAEAEIHPAFSFGCFVFSWQLWRQFRNLRHGARTTMKCVKDSWHPATEIEPEPSDVRYHHVIYDWWAREIEIIAYGPNNEFEGRCKIKYRWNRIVRIDLFDEDGNLTGYTIHRYRGLSFLNIEDYSPEGGLLRINTDI